jgi:hypothetical protein
MSMVTFFRSSRVISYQLVACDDVMFGDSVFEQLTERYIPEIYTPN